MMFRTKALTTGMLAALLALGTAGAAAGAAPGVLARTTCSDGTRALLTLSRDDGHVEAEIELHADRAGQAWRIRFFNEGARESSATRRTTAEDGGGTLSVSRLLTDHPGPDSITVRARNTVTGERCVVRATL